MRKILLSAFAATLVSMGHAEAATPSQIYVFGDSLVDAGNISVATGGATPNPAQGYFKGRFTNGYNFPDFLSIAAYGSPTAPSLAGGNNFAFGGARAAVNVPAAGGLSIPSVVTQVGSYLTRSSGKGDADGLYIINIGGNDIFALQSGNTGGLAPQAYVDLTVNNIVTAVTSLNAAGAGNILVTGIPNFTPLAFQVDAQLQTALDGLDLNANLLRFSYTSFYTKLLADPAAYGLGPNPNFSTPCRQAQPVVNGSINCFGYFSFDGTHPTAAVQFALAREIGTIVGINGVPEPETWAMMIVGFGLVGSALRRRVSAVTTTG